MVVIEEDIKWITAIAISVLVTSAKADGQDPQEKMQGLFVLAGLALVIAGAINSFPLIIVGGDIERLSGLKNHWCENSRRNASRELIEAIEGNSDDSFCQS